MLRIKMIEIVMNKASIYWRAAVWGMDQNSEEAHCSVVLCCLQINSSVPPGI